MALPGHFFVSESDGGLYDTRVSNWSALPPLRPNYSMGHRAIETLADLKACLRNGGYAWPGGYPLYFLTKDGEALAFTTVRQEFKTICHAWDDPQWRIVGCDVNWEDNDLIDAHTGAKIESAYGENDDT